MNRARTRLTLVALALALGAAGAALGHRSAPAAAAPATQVTVEAVDPFALAAILAEGPADTVVIAFDDAKHPLRGAMPAAAFGADDTALVAAAPKARRIILAGSDLVRMDRVARKLLTAGRRVSVLAGGNVAWDKLMDADPPAPAAGSSAQVWKTYRTRVALRRSFGDASAAPAAPVAAPVAPAMAAPGGGPKKREGC